MRDRKAARFRCRAEQPTKPELAAGRAYAAGMHILSRIAIGTFVCLEVLIVVITMAKGPRWFWALKKWARVALSGSLSLLVGLGIWGVATEDERSELTFVAPADDYVWPNVPLRVWTPPGDGYIDEVATAINIWNRSARCDLFAQERYQAAAQVRIRAFDGLPCGKPFRDLHGVDAEEGNEGTWDCKDGTNEVLLNNPGDFETGARGAIHGLGHVLRLAHDASGVMAKGIRPLNVLLPNDKDIAALRARYCSELR
jgi:hypothetical protein